MTATVARTDAVPVLSHLKGRLALTIFQRRLMMTQCVQLQCCAQVHEAMATALHDQRVCRGAACFAAANGLVFNSNLLSERQAIRLAHRPNAFGKEFAARQCSSLRSAAKVLYDAGQAADWDT